MIIVLFVLLPDLIILGGRSTASPVLHDGAQVVLGTWRSVGSWEKLRAFTCNEISPARGSSSKQEISKKPTTDMR